MTVLRTHGPALARLVSAYARDRSEREDLQQDIALALWVALPRFRGECPERAFVLRVAHNRALTLVTRRRRTITVVIDEDLDPVDPAPHPEAVLHDRQRRRLLLAAIRRLPLAQRQALLLSLEGLDHDEIGGVLGINANAVGVRVHRARAALELLLTGDPR